VPLYLVTMASQNLPGFAVLRASGYQPPTQPVLGVTGAARWRRLPRRAHLESGGDLGRAVHRPEAHPDPAKRWIAGSFYALWWGLIALFGASLVGLFGALPPALLMHGRRHRAAGLDGKRARQRTGPEKDRLAAAGTLAVHGFGNDLDWHRLGVLGSGVRSARAGSGGEEPMVRLVSAALIVPRRSRCPAFAQQPAPPVREITKIKDEVLSFPQQQPLFGVRRDRGRHHRYRSDQRSGARPGSRRR
jgi:hypothetical protein